MKTYQVTITSCGRDFGYSIISSRDRASVEKSARHEAERLFAIVDGVTAEEIAGEDPDESAALKAIIKWATSSHDYLSNREGYPRGYRDGISSAKNTVKSIIIENGIDINDYE